MATSSDIQAKANDIRNKIYGKDVREALASGIEAIDGVAEDVKTRQGTVETDFTTIQQSEATRQTNEQTRQSNETSRQNAESARVTAETARATAESTRQTNETAREKIINNFKSFGAYDTNTTYSQYNTVTYQGSTYMCLQDSTQGILPTDGTKWITLAIKGSDGVGGDMFKATYDTNNNGIVDNAENAENSAKLGGQLPAYYALASDLLSHTENTTNAHGINLKANQSDLEIIKIRMYMGV